ncbi:MAG: PEP-CTERM-box response regulator transcription factor [Planctomycetes bacterium RBG_16_43_13]|nr:MAG: PEP-CTERM-box response regulator transcription factor [Planctomycetes bacterium RBG_16_43_13]
MDIAAITSDSQDKPKLLIVDDEDFFRIQMRWSFSREYQILEAKDRISALKIAEMEHPHVVMLDLDLPPIPGKSVEGLQTLRELLDTDPTIKVIIVTGKTERRDALKAIEIGAYDYFTKPINKGDAEFTLRRAFYLAQLEKENYMLKQHDAMNGVKDMIGTSPAMQQVFKSIRKVAAADVPVLILGDSGTGKELAARAIHTLSSRRDHPFTVINCCAIPENLVESELFGHEKGAFTGASIQRKGRIEHADRGTLFLDEIGELSIVLQVKLLRFLQDNVIERIGGRRAIHVNLRVIAATNRNLIEAVKKGEFREDLFYRLSVITISMPPLKARGEDLLLLVRIFLYRYSRRFKKNISGFTPEAIRALEGYSWPGNVRELENFIKRAIIMAEGEMITVNDLNLASVNIDIPESKSITLQSIRKSIEKRVIQKTLLKHGSIIYKAAEELGVTRQTLSYLIRKYKIKIS